MDIHSCHLLFDHFQFAWIHGPNIPGFYAILLFIASDFTSITSTGGWCFCFGSISSFFLELFLPLSPVAYWAPTDLESSSFSVHHSLAPGKEQEGNTVHSSAVNYIKDLLSMAQSIRTRSSFPLSQSIPSGSFHKPLILLHQRADRMKHTITEN